LDHAIFIDRFGHPLLNDKGLPTREIVEFARVVTGNTPSRTRPDYYGDSIEWLKSDNLNAPEYYATQAKEGLSDDGMRVSRRVPPNSILITCIAGSPNSIGNAAMTDREVAFNQQINALVPFEGDPHFIYAQFRFEKRLVQSASTKAMKGMVSKSRFERIRLLFPPVEEQREYGRIALQIESVRSNQRESREALNTLFVSLQQRAFSGEL
jgi:type I restriction enzyme, S subunit